MDFFTTTAAMETVSTPIFDFFFKDTTLFGTVLALLGAAIAVIFSGIGSAKGVGMVSEASAGLLTEAPERFGSALVLQALPATQGIYGFVISFLIILNLGVLNGNLDGISLAKGLYFFVAALPVGISGWISAVKQARVATAGISVVAKRPDAVGKAIISAALVEMYAILSFLVSILLVLSSSKVFANF